MKLNTKVVPCVILSLFIHPSTQHHIIDRICWAFSVYLESVSVLPQRHVIQNTKVLETRGRLLIALGHGLWPSMVLVSEIVQPFISKFLLLLHQRSEGHINFLS